VPEQKNDEKHGVVKNIAATKKVAKKKVAKKKVVQKKVVQKKAVTKKVTKKKITVRAAAGTRQNVFNQKDRYEMIAKMAYFRAEKRGFEPGWEQEDWLQCEKLVDEMLSKA
jgi:hypothetical protein